MASRREVSWAEIEAACEVLYARLPSHLSSITPVGRGGLVPAAIIAYRLKLPVVHLAPGMPASSLILDDVVDTGWTFAELRCSYPHAHYAALYVKPLGKSFCQWWAELVPQEVWLSFPWAPNDEVNR